MIKIVRYLFLIFLFSMEVHAYKLKPSCDATELGLKNCPLQVYGYRFHFFKDKILIHDGIWRTIEKFPLVGAQVEWDSIRLKKLKGNVFIEILVWTPPEGLAKVQDLVWHVFKIEKSRLKLMVKRVVQKRSVAEGDSKNAPKYIHDKRHKFGLRLKDKKPIWYHRQKSGSLL